MKFTDIANPERVNKSPDQIISILENGNFIEQGFKITKIDLCLYIEKQDNDLGNYSLITSVVYTDKDSMEMIYDEGFRGDNPLLRASEFVTSTLGISGIVLRSLISLKEELDRQGHNI